MKRHRPEDHRAACYCGKKATVHVAYGSGCGNVCDEHAASIKRVKRAVRVESLGR